MEVLYIKKPGSLGMDAVPGVQIPDDFVCKHVDNLR